MYTKCPRCGLEVFRSQFTPIQLTCSNLKIECGGCNFWFVVSTELLLDRPNQREALKVSDWSQPIKIGMMIGALIWGAYVAGKILGLLQQIVNNTR